MFKDMTALLHIIMNKTVNSSPNEAKKKKLYKKNVMLSNATRLTNIYSITQ